MKSIQKTLLIGTVLIFILVPFVSKELTASESKFNQQTQVIQKHDSSMNGNDFRSSANKQELNELEVEVLMNGIEYHAQIFVDAEISLEMLPVEHAIQENPQEFIFAESSKLEGLMNIAPYDAGKYVEDEMLIESANHASYETFLDEAELLTVEGCNNEVTRFAQTLVWLQEQKAERQNFATAISN